MESLFSTSKRHRYFIDAAVEQAKKSKMKQRHGAVVVKGGEIIGSGQNYDYGLQIIHGHWSVHSEVNAIDDCKRNKKNIDGATIYVVRINPAGELRNSKPCSNCARWIFANGIHKVFYSINPDEIQQVTTEVISIDDIEQGTYNGVYKEVIKR